jgi:hypothetical protein
MYYLLFYCPMLVIKLLVPLYLMAIGLEVLLQVQLVLEQGLTMELIMILLL